MMVKFFSQKFCSCILPGNFFVLPNMIICCSNVFMYFVVFEDYVLIALEKKQLILKLKLLLRLGLMI